MPLALLPTTAAAHSHVCSARLVAPLDEPSIASVYASELAAASSTAAAAPCSASLAACASGVAARSSSSPSANSRKSSTAASSLLRQSGTIWRQSWRTLCWRGGRAGEKASSAGRALGYRLERMLLTCCLTFHSSASLSASTLLMRSRCSWTSLTYVCSSLVSLRVEGQSCQRRHDAVEAGSLTS